MSLPESVLEGKYEVVRQISEGGMGAVYLVRHLHLEQDQVIKVIRPQHAANEDLQKRFRREAQIAIRLRHPKIAEIYDFSIGNDGTAYLVMEFIDGRTLENLMLQGERMALGLTLEIAVQTLEALEFLHHRGFIHRDISPDNVMLTRDFDGEPLVKLIDLGIAKRIGDDASGALTQAGMFVGKARYSSPEHCGRGELGPLSDLYSFGVLLYELLTGTSPIPGTTVPELIGAHLLTPPLAFGETDPDGRVPEQLRAIVMQALEKKSSRRMASAREFITLLEPLRQGISPVQTAHDLDHTLRLPVGAFVGPAREAAPDRVSAALSSARLLVGQSLFDEARTELHRVLEMDPRNSEAMHILSMVEELLRHRAEAQRQGAITDQAEKIEKLLARGQLALAGDELAGAVAEYGEAELFHQMHLRLERALVEEREHQQRLQALALLAEAEHHLDGEDLPATQRSLDAVRELAVRDTEIERRLAGIEEAADRATAEREEAEHQQRQARIAELLTNARHYLEAQVLGQAGEEVQAALALAPSHREAQELLREVEAAQQQEAERRQWEEACREAVTRIDKQLSEGQLGAAAEALKAAEKKLGAGGDFGRLRLKLEQQARISTLLEKGRKHLGAGELEQAEQRVEEILALEPGHLTAGALLEAIETNRRERRIADEVERLDACLEQGDLRQAGELLAAAERDYGPQPSFWALRERLEKLLAAERAEQIAPLLAQARRDRDAGDPEQALEALRQARELNPGNAEARLLLKETKAEIARREQQRRQAEATSALEVLLGRGELDAAQDRLARAEREFGVPAVRQLRQRLTELEIIQRARELCDEARTAALNEDFDAARVRIREALELDPDNPAATSLHDHIEEAVRRADELAREAAVAAAEAEAEDLLARGMLTRAGKRLGATIELYSDLPKFRELQERHQQACREEEQRRAETRKKVAAEMPWAVAAVLAIAFGLTVGWLLSSTTPQPRPPAATGTAIVNAVPWGRLVDILDETENPHPAAPRGAYTPISIALPPGKYIAQLENAHFPQPISIEIEVASGEQARGLARFDEVSVDEFLHADPSEELRAAAEAFLNAEFDQVLIKLQDVDWSDSKARPTSHLLLAAAQYAIFLEGGAKDEGLEDAAAASREACHRLNPDLDPSSRWFSPGFIHFFKQR